MAKKPRTASTPGPKPKLTDQVKREILEALLVGASLAEAMLAYSISRGSLQHERRQDPEFDRGIKSASVRGKIYHQKRIHAGVPNWQSSAWFLERKYGAEFGQKVKVDQQATVRLELVEELIDAPPPHPSTNGQAAPGTTGIPPR